MNSFIVFPGFLARQVTEVFLPAAVARRFLLASSRRLHVVLILAPRALHHLFEILLRIEQRAPVQLAGRLAFQPIEKCFQFVLAGTRAAWLLAIELALDLRQAGESIHP